jgi:hypothetical protein
MGLPRRQFDSLTAKKVLTALQEGRMPSLGEIALGLREIVIDERRGLPLMKIRPQAKKSKWDIASFNQTLEDFDFDMTVLYEELVDMGAKLLRRHNMQTASYRSQSRQLDSLVGNLNSLLFTLQNADDRFFGVFDNFQDLTKVDLDLTTKNAVDLEEAVVLLPAGVSSAKKLEMRHLFDRTVWGVKPFVADGVRVLKNQPGVGAEFGNAFQDLVNVWRQDILTDTQAPVTIEFTVPISAVESQKVSVTRIQLVPHISQEVELTVLYSVDGVNYLKLPDRSEFVLKRGDKVLNLDIPRTRTRFVKFVMTSNTPDEILEEGKYRYSFGFQHIGFYTIGRIQDAEFITVAQKPANMSNPIARVALTTLEEIPADCDLKYFVSRSTAAGTRLGPWRPISPINRQVSDAPIEILFTNDGTKKRLIRGDAAVAHSIRKNHTYYTIDSTEPVLDDVIFGSAKLLRGRNAWVRNSKRERILRTVRDAFIDFSNGNTQKIYAVLREVAGVDSKAHPTLANDPSVTWLELDQIVDYDSSFMDLVPAEGIDIDTDQTPNYAVYSVKRFRQEMTITDESVVLTAFTNSSLAEPNVVIIGAEKPVVTNTGKTIIYEQDKDYKLTLDTNGAVQIRRSEGTSSQIGDGQTVLVTYTLDPDITSLVSAVKDNNVVLTQDLVVRDDERFEVTYRFIPVGDNKIVKRTIQASERYGPNTGRIFQEGPDYSIDIQNGTITRIPQGDIQGAGTDADTQIAAYVDFKYTETPKTIDTFSTWVFVESSQPIQFEFNPLNIDLEAGERVEILSGPDVQDISNQTQSPELARGWHQVIVRSKDPDSFTDAAIRKITTLQDVDTQGVFLAGGRYFSLITANRVPMRQVTLQYLRSSTLPSNHNVFAIDGNGNVVVTFAPGTTEDLYLYGLRMSPTTNQLTAGTWPEEFELEYRFQLTNALTTEYLLFRALLTRRGIADNGVTPKLHEYHLRMG